MIKYFFKAHTQSYNHTQSVISWQPRRTDCRPSAHYSLNIEVEGCISRTRLKLWKLHFISDIPPSNLDEPRHCAMHFDQHHHWCTLNIIHFHSRRLWDYASTDLALSLFTVHRLVSLFHSVLDLTVNVIIGTAHRIVLWLSLKNDLINIDF